MKNRQSTNSQRQNLNLDTNLFENQSENPMSGQKTQKISERIKHQISTHDFSLEELTDILDTTAKKITRSLYETDKTSPKAAKFYSDKVKVIISILRSFLFRQNSESHENKKGVFSIALGSSAHLKLRTKPSYPKNRYWYLNDKNLGRDTEEIRHKIKIELDIDLAEVAPDLPPVLPPIKPKSIIKKAGR